MSWRSLVISNPARLSLNNGQLLIEQDEKITVPLEDIGVIVIEDQRIILTAKLLSRMADFGILLFICDDKHMPSSIFTPFFQHSRQRRVLGMQLGLSKVFVKRCWKEIIVQKISNQAECMRILNKESVARELESIKKDVQSGDTTNREAYASQIYFKNFGEGLKRSHDNVLNIALNYGYAIIRGAIARCIVSYGFLPALGIHHRSELNNFNLADDFMEPFRPLVDLWVASNFKMNDDFSKEKRVQAVGLLHNDIMMGSEKISVLSAIDRMVASYSTACTNQNHQAIRLPRLINLNSHINNE